MRIITVSYLLCICSIHMLWSQTGLLDNPPKDKAEVFLPNILSTSDHEHSKISVSPDGKSIYWSFLKLPHSEGEERKIAFVTRKNGKWGIRKIAEFNSEYGSDSPCFWGNDKIVFHAKRKMNVDSTDFIDDFWIVKRQEDGWSEPQPLGFTKFPAIKKWAELAPLHNLPMPSVSGNGNIYFMDRYPGSTYKDGGIYVSNYKNNHYSPPFLLSEQINSEYNGWEPFIAPDESYLMFSSDHPGGYGNEDIYIVFRKKDGSWSIPINMGEKVNSEEDERFPSIAPDGKIMFFLIVHEGENRVYYWIDAVFIEDLKPEELK